MLCLAMLLIGPSDPLDRRLSDRLLVRQALPAEPALLVVEINAADMRAYGGPPISRALLARMLDRLAEGGARRVLVDLILTEPLDAGVDRQLSAAMRRLGPQRLALVSGVNPGERPYAAFMRSTALVDGRLTPDPDSWHRRIGYADANWGANPAIWLATGRADPAPVALDLRISARAVERRSAGQLLASRDSLDGRIVVISASPQIAPSRVMLPLNQAASRGTVLALAAQGVLQGYPAMQERGAIMNGVLLVMSVALGFAAALSARSGRMLVLLLLAGGAVLFSLSLAVGRSYAVEVFPARILATFLVMANVTVIQRLRIVPMMASFLRGDVTPEEAWVWRSWENSSHPALLLAADFPQGLPPRWWAVGVLMNNNLGRMAVWGPTLRRLLLAGDWHGAAEQMRHYRNADGRPSLGLRRRRWAEAAFALGLDPRSARDVAWDRITSPDDWPRLPR